MGRCIKKIFGILIVAAMILQSITAVYAASALDVELSGIDYVLTKGTRQVNLSALSNKMEVRVKLKNTSDSAKTVKIRVDGYKNGSIVSGQTKISDSVSLASGAVSDEIIVRMGNVKTYCDTLKVFAVSDG